MAQIPVGGWGSARSRLIYVHVKRALATPVSVFFTIPYATLTWRTAVSITVGGSGKSVDRLEAHGDCRRRANPQDRRPSLLELTEEGRLALATAVFEWALHRRVGVILDPASLAQFHARLRDAGYNLA
jgi:hypothetical protein